MNVCMSVTERNTLWVVGHVTRFLTFYINGMKRKNTVQMFAVLVLEETMEDMEDTEAMEYASFALFLSLLTFPLLQHSASTTLYAGWDDQESPSSGLSALTTVSSLGAAPCWSRTLMMWVCPCCAAWCSGVYPFCRHKERERLHWAQHACHPHRTTEAEAENSPLFWH